MARWNCGLGNTKANLRPVGSIWGGGVGHDMWARAVSFGGGGGGGGVVVLVTLNSPNPLEKYCGVVGMTRGIILEPRIVRELYR